MKFDMSSKRKEKKLTQFELGELCGVAQRTIAAYESGERRPSPEVAQKIGAVLEIPWTRFYEEDQDTEE